MQVVLQQLQLIVGVSSSDDVHQAQSGAVHLPALFQDVSAVFQT